MARVKSPDLLIVEWSLICVDDEEYEAGLKAGVILEEAWQKIRMHLPSNIRDIRHRNIKQYVDDIYGCARHIQPYVGQSDSDVRVRLFELIGRYYNMDHNNIGYNIVYDKWLE